MVVVDECDKLEGEILRFVSLNISDRQMERFKLEPPKYKTKPEPKDIREGWKKWAERYLPIIGKQLEILGVQFKKGRQDITFLRSYKSTSALHKKMTIFKDIVDDTWIYEEKENRWEFKPTWISQFMNDYFWSHAKRFVLMSATPPPPKLLGLEGCEQISIPSQFPKENRRVIYESIANLTFKTMNEEKPKLLKRIKEIMDSHPKEKGLIHTVSYSLADYLVKNLKSDRILTHNGRGRTDALERFKRDSYPVVLISPSMDRGVDLPYDAARWCIVCKVPFPDLSDKQVSSRLYSSSFGRYWYAWITACSLMQMTGRIVRAVDDWGVSYILDKQFETFYGKNAGLFYGWWTEALELSI
jgi:Rad3-related DNA helicase